MKRILIGVLALLIVFQLGIISYIFDVSNNQNKNINNTTINNIDVNGFNTDITEELSNIKSQLVLISDNGVNKTGIVYKHNNDIYYVISAYDNKFDTEVSVQFDNEQVINGYVKYINDEYKIMLVEVQLNFSVKTVNLGDANVIKQGEYGLLVDINEQDYQDIDFNIIVDQDYIKNNEVYFLINHRYLSGLPLFNMSGDFIGVSVSSDVKNKAVSVNELNIIFDNVINNTEFRKIDYLVEYTLISNMKNYQKSTLNISLNNTSGLYIKQISDNSIFKQIDINTGDIILSINDHKINNIYDFRKFVYLAQDIKELKVKVLSQGEESDRVLKLND